MGKANNLRLRSSHRSVVADDLVAVLAAMFLIVASRDAEGDHATSEPAAKKGENCTEDPGECSLRLIGLGDSILATELTSDLLGLVLEHHILGLHDYNLLRLGCWLAN